MNDTLAGLLRQLEGGDTDAALVLGDYLEEGGDPRCAVVRREAARDRNYLKQCHDPDCLPPVAGRFRRVFNAFRHVIHARLTAPEVADRLRAYVRTHELGTVGGSLHIVLDDNNYEDHHVAWCEREAVRTGDTDGSALARLYLFLSRTQRGKLDAVYSDESRRTVDARAHAMTMLYNLGAPMPRSLVRAMFGLPDPRPD